MSKDRDFGYYEKRYHRSKDYQRNPYWGQTEKQMEENKLENTHYLIPGAFMPDDEESETSTVHYKGKRTLTTQHAEQASLSCYGGSHGAELHHDHSLSSSQNNSSLASESSSASLSTTSPSPPYQKNFPQTMHGRGGRPSPLKGGGPPRLKVRRAVDPSQQQNLLSPKPGQSFSQSQPQPLAPWRLWESLAVNVGNLPPQANSLALWKAFQKEGNIVSIDIFEDFHGNRDAKGKVRFRPPPREDFWRNGSYCIILRDGSESIITLRLDAKPVDKGIPSPIRPNVTYPFEVKLNIDTMDIGALIDETTMLPLRTVGINADEETPSIHLNLGKKVMYVYFQLPAYYYPRSDGKYHQYRLNIAFRQMPSIFQSRDANSVSLFMVLDSPPMYYRRAGDIPNTFMDEGSWREEDSWYRQTNIVLNPLSLAKLPTGLRKTKPMVDIGRWKAFRMKFLKDSEKLPEFALLCNILNDYNVTIENTDKYTLLDDEERPIQIWKWIDLAPPPNANTASLEDLIDKNYVHLSFPVRYQLEVCISHGFLSEFNMTREFAVKLSELKEADAVKLLEHVAERKQVYYDPMKIFDLYYLKGVTDAKIPSYCCYMRTARITPSTIYYNTPSVDISNRIIRRYVEYADRFLRVRFTDEKWLGRVNSTVTKTNDEIFTRIKRALANGIIIGDRRYEFLAFGNSQFREHGAYFFAPLPNITAATIRGWMGTFTTIRNVAKHAARLGQCFSTTRAIAGTSVTVREIDDVERNGYTFSDGVGRISHFLAQMVTSELKIKTPTGKPPSAFQFRLGGSKGMLTVSSEATLQEVHVRRSQNKFEALHNGLEIIRWSQFSVATLNRQLILVLSTLGIPDIIFHSRLQGMLQGLNEIMDSDSQAIHWLRKFVDPNQMSLVVSEMVSDGFRRAKEPFMTSILALWKAWHLKYLKEKARIPIDKGANLLGCMDETGILQGYFIDKIPKKPVSQEEKKAALPQIFVQVCHPDNDGKYEVIEGLCILARNPSLHPGDIRVVNAVNVPELRHLHDVVVLPQTGDRDIASMCSGGDLDGDDYLVIWDKDLIPEKWFLKPMAYESNRAPDMDHDVTVDEITSFFVTYMQNDCLPQVAHAHLAWADWLENGVNEDKCIRLAQLHSDAVDYNKTGIPAIMTRSMMPRMWPHFMEKNHKPKEKIYPSRKILGQLYDSVERIDFAPSLEMPFDKRILACQIEVPEDMYQFARTLKASYDEAMRRIMAQHEIKTEFEVWSTFVMSHANMSKDYKFHEDIGVLSSALREGFRKKCYDKAGGRHFEQLAPLVLAMYRITHEEMSTALKKYYEANPKDELSFHKPTPNIDDLPLISFPWILPNILGKIAAGHYELDAPENQAPGAGNLLDLSDDPGSSSFHSETRAGYSNNHLHISESMALVPIHPVQNLPDLAKSLLMTPGLDESVYPKKKLIRTLATGIEGLENLLDFGLMESPTSSSFPTVTDLSGLGCSKEERNNLLEWNDGSDDAGQDGSKAVGESKDKPQVVEEDSTHAVEVVEEDAEIGPTALDRLNELLGDD